MSSSEVQALENEVKEYKLQLETVQLSLQNDPENVELESLQAELEEVISLTESAIAELKPASVSARVPSPPQPLVKEKWSKQNHPAYQAGYRKPEAEPEESNPITTFAVNDTVSARWKSGDGGYYTARITSITGSASDPVYIVTFKNYGNNETLRAKDIKPLSTDARKRKADNMSGTSTPTSAPVNPNIISAAASVDPTLAQQARREPSKVSDGPIRPAKIPRKVKANKELEAGKNKWQDFAAKSKIGKTQKKDSMFRTGDGVNARGKLYIPKTSMVRFHTNLNQSVSQVAGTKCGKTLLGLDMSTTREGRMIRTSSREHLISFYAVFLSFERLTIYASQVLTHSQITDSFSAQGSPMKAQSSRIHILQDKYLPEYLLYSHLTRLFSLPGIWTRGPWRFYSCLFTPIY